MKEKIIQLEKEKENYEFLAEGLTYEHQIETKNALLRKVNAINEEILELKKLETFRSIYYRWVR